MTMPHLMNCSHQGEGWCIDCVREEWERNSREAASLGEYADLVRRMRAVQTRYFRGERSSAVMQEAKKLEREVDVATRAILDPPQPTLFDEEGDH